MRLPCLFVAGSFVLTAGCRSRDADASAQVDPLLARDTAESATPASEPLDELLATLGVRRVASGDAVEVRGWVNMTSGAIEVLACAPEGKLHEALLVLDCVPSGLHAGLLALGLEPGRPGIIGGGGEFTPPSGDAVEVSVTWKDASGPERSARVEDWLLDTRRNAAMKPQPWVYAGSFEMPIEGKPGSISLAADSVKTILATYHDSTALLQVAGSDGLDDTLYQPNSAVMPPKGTPVAVTFRRAR